MGAKCCGLHYEHHNKAQAKDKLGAVPLHEKQIQMLHLIYNDLAQRVVERAISLQNFILFFHKNGYWGERLFKEFCPNDKKQIQEREFIIGMAKLFKANQQQKIQLLFHEFSNKNKKLNASDSPFKQEGISYDNFLVMLYNYPKTDLKNVLNDQEFFQTQLRGCLKTIGQNRRLESVYKMGSYTSKPVECRIDQKTESGGLEQGTNKQFDQFRSSYGSLVGKNILKNLNSNKSQQMTLKIQDGDNLIQIKTNDFHQLVKKFARKMFRDMKLNKITQKMSKVLFEEWILSHPKLYETYYDGFHNQVWQIDEASQKPKYLSCPFQISSVCKYFHPNFCDRDEKYIRVQALVLQSVIILACQQNLEEPYETICLDGLTVQSISDKVGEFGIAINHREGIYQKRQFIFTTQQDYNQWFDALKLFKGTNVQTLYTFQKKIGTGRFSVVYEAIEKKTNEKYAIKVIESYKLEPDEKKLIDHETSIMQVLCHPLLVQYKTCFQTKTHLYIIAELCEGKDLFQFVRDYSCITEYEASIVLQQIILGLMHMHSLGIVHRDLKPENIMVSSEDNFVKKIKIIDFGFANYLEALQQMPPEQLLAGTPNFIAPEILKRGKISFKIDVFAVGSILYYMLSGNLPFNDFSLAQIFNKTLDSDYEYPSKSFGKISEQAKDLIDRFLQNDPNIRISLEDALKHPWFQTVNNNKNHLIKPQKVKNLQIF